METTMTKKPEVSSEQIEERKKAAWQLMRDIIKIANKFGESILENENNTQAWGDKQLGRGAGYMVYVLGSALNKFFAETKLPRQDLSSNIAEAHGDPMLKVRLDALRKVMDAMNGEAKK